MHTRAPEEPVSWARLRALTMATLFPFRSIVSRLVVLQPSGVKSLWGREGGVGGEEVSGQPPRFLGTRTGDCGANRANLLLGDVLQHHVNVQIEALEGTHELSLVFQDHLVCRVFSLLLRMSEGEGGVESASKSWKSARTLSALSLALRTPLVPWVQRGAGPPDRGASLSLPTNSPTTWTRCTCP